MILIAGGTGTLGRRLVPLIARRDIGVRLFARHPEAAGTSDWGAGVEIVRGDVQDARALDAALVGVDTVVSAISGFGGSDPLGTKSIDRAANITLIDAANRANVDHFVLLSVHQAGPDHPIELFRDKWAAEQALRASGSSWTIIRPTAYLETWLGLIGDPIVVSGKTRIFGGGQNPVNFVSAGDVARFVELAIADSTLRQRAIEVPGPENLTFDDLADKVESVTGRHATRQHLSPAIMRVAALAMRLPKPVLSAQIAAALVMDSRDMAVDGPALRAAFPSIPMTGAREVAGQMFGPSAAAQAIRAS